MAVLEYASPHPYFSDPFSNSDPCTGDNRYRVGPLLAFHVQQEVECWLSCKYLIASARAKSAPGRYFRRVQGKEGHPCLTATHRS